MTKPHATWASHWTFLLAAIGSAVGLGNIWKFPYITGEYGGGAFVLVYLVCIALIGVPIMISEVLIGRASKQNPVHGMYRLAKDSDKSGAWGLVGAMGVLTGLMILSFYSPIAGWALEYAVNVGNQSFANSNADAVGVQFTQFLGNTAQLTKMHTIFILVSGIIIALGVVRGLGLAIRVLMPILFVLLFILLYYSITHGDFQKALSFMFATDFSKLSNEAILSAMGHAFFTLSLGMGAIMTYGSYMPDKPSIAKTVFVIAFFDTLIALLAGLVIFPLTFANGLDPSSGPGLLFVSLPIAFGNMEMGHIYGLVFFSLVCIAAWSSAISILEPGVAWLERLGIHRVLATTLLSLLAWLGGWACIQSNNWAGSSDAPRQFFEWIDYIASNILLPLGGLLISIFASWKMRRKLARTQLKGLSEGQFNTWYALSRVIAPLCIIVVLLNSTGLLDKFTGS
ncbi:MAG: sodium-dependent transporter [Pseudomonadota bacterium]